MQSFKIIEAKISDLAQIQELSEQLFKFEHKWHPELDMAWSKNKWGKKYVTYRLTHKNGLVLLAKDKNKIVGYLTVGLLKKRKYRLEHKAAEIENLYITEKYRGLGVGSQLIEHFFAWCRKQEVDRVTVEAVFENKIGIKFYKKYGFKEYTIDLETSL